MEYRCSGCGQTEMFTKKQGTQVGLYCSNCGKWQKWLGKSELRAFRHSQNELKASAESLTIRPSKQHSDIKIPALFSTEQFGARYQAILSPVNIGTLCCFKHNGYIYFGYLAGIVVDDFEQMSFTYVLKCDDRYFFSKECIEKPPHIHTAHEAEEYWNTLSNQESED